MDQDTLMDNRIYTAPLLLSALILSACGGGGDGDSGSTLKINEVTSLLNEHFIPDNRTSVEYSIDGSNKTQNCDYVGTIEESSRTVCVVYGDSQKADTLIIPEFSDHVDLIRFIPASDAAAIDVIAQSLSAIEFGNTYAFPVDLGYFDFMNEITGDAYTFRSSNLAATEAYCRLIKDNESQVYQYQPPAFESGTLEVPTDLPSLEAGQYLFHCDFTYEGTDTSVPVFTFQVLDINNTPPFISPVAIKDDGSLLMHEGVLRDINGDIVIATNSISDAEDIYLGLDPVVNFVRNEGDVDSSIAIPFIEGGEHQQTFDITDSGGRTIEVGFTAVDSQSAKTSALINLPVHKNTAPAYSSGGIYFDCIEGNKFTLPEAVFVDAESDEFTTVKSLGDGEVVCDGSKNTMPYSYTSTDIWGSSAVSPTFIVDVKPNLRPNINRNGLLSQYRCRSSNNSGCNQPITLPTCTDPEDDMSPNPMVATDKYGSIIKEYLVPGATVTFRLEYFTSTIELYLTCYDRAGNASYSVTTQLVWENK